MVHSSLHTLAISGIKLEVHISQNSKSIGELQIYKPMEGWMVGGQKLHFSIGFQFPCPHTIIHLDGAPGATSSLWHSFGDPSLVLGTFLQLLFLFQTWLGFHILNHGWVVLWMRI